MTKYVLIIAALFAVAFLASCNKEVSEPAEISGVEWPGFNHKFTPFPLHLPYGYWKLVSMTDHDFVTHTDECWTDDYIYITKGRGYISQGKCIAVPWKEKEVPFSSGFIETSEPGKHFVFGDDTVKITRLSADTMEFKRQYPTNLHYIYAKMK